MSGDTEVYARLENGKVVEYPVFAIHIKNRAHPFSWYKKVYFEPRPEIPRFSNLRETLKIVKDDVIASYELYPMTINEVLFLINNPSGTPPMPGETPPVVTIDQVSPADVQKAAEATTAEVTRRLDKWAQERNYDNITTLITYQNSPIPKFKAEADRAVQVRDLTYVALYNYLDKVMTGQVPVPKTFEQDILPELPGFTWE